MLLNTIRIRTFAAVIGALTAGFVLSTTPVAAGPVAPFGLAPQVATPMPTDESDTDDRPPVEEVGAQHVPLKSVRAA